MKECSGRADCHYQYKQENRSLEVFRPGVEVRELQPHPPPPAPWNPRECFTSHLLPLPHKAHPQFQPALHAATRVSQVTDSTSLRHSCAIRKPFLCVPFMSQVRPP